MPASEKPPGVMLKNLALSLADGVPYQNLLDLLYQLMVQWFLYYIFRAGQCSINIYFVENIRDNREKLLCPVLIVWLITLSAQAPASRLRRFAQAALQEAEETGACHVSGAIRRAGKLTQDNLKNSERDLLSLFRRYGLTIPVKLSTIRCGLLHLHYISAETWFRFLLDDYPHLLLGGFNSMDPRSGLLLKSFWETFRESNPDHFVFREHPTNLNRCLPFYWHLDEGTSLRKSAVLVFNLQTAFGCETATVFDSKFTEGSGRSDADMKRFMVESMCHNQRGSSLKTRFLYTIIPKRWYTKKFAFVYDKVLDRLATETAALASEGVHGMYPICLGIKGDAPALAKAAHYTRSFMTLGLLSYLFLQFASTIQQAYDMWYYACCMC